MGSDTSQGNTSCGCPGAGLLTADFDRSIQGLHLALTDLLQQSFLQCDLQEGRCTLPKPRPVLGEFSSNDSA